MLGVYVGIVVGYVFLFVDDVLVGGFFVVVVVGGV